MGVIDPEGIKPKDFTVEPAVCLHTIAPENSIICPEVNCNLTLPGISFPCN